MDPAVVAEQMAGLPVVEARAEFSRIVDESKQLKHTPEDDGKFKAALSFNAALVAEMVSRGVNIWEDDEDDGTVSQEA